MASRDEEKYEHEHTQALLADDDLTEYDSSLSDLYSEQDTRTTHWRLKALGAFFGIIISIGIVLLASGRSVRSGQVSQDAKTTVLRNDYILDTEWDYASAAQLREYEWTLEETEFNPDGVFRPMLLINNQFPGPLIEVNEGDTIRVTIHNHLSNSTSVHWHGIFQNGTNFMDGTVGVTQCPIAPQAMFIYEFTVTGQSGTYWYHAHQGTQTSDGLAGPLVIHSRDERDSRELDYSVDRIVMLSDHYHRLSSALTRQYLAPDMENTEPVPDGALINGRAIRNCDDLPGKRCDNTTIVQPQFHMQAQQSQRLRIINVGAFAEFQFQIDEHELAIVEVDGTDVQPAYYHRLNISPAQRYSVIVHANQTHRDSFRMRARMVDSCFASHNSNMIKEVDAIVAYGKGSTIVPDSLDWTERLDIECRDMNTTELIPTKAIQAPSKEDDLFYLRINFQIGAYRLSRGFFNESTWKPNVTSPSLFRFLDTPSSSPSTSITDSIIDTKITSPQDQLTISTPTIRTIDILIHNTDDSSHPMHLHGYKFFILSSGRGYPPRTSLLEGVSRSTVQPIYDALDLTNPLRRDTATVEADGWMLIRFVADNPGVWAFHCHIAWHGEAGLMMQFATMAERLREMEVPRQYRDLCHANKEVLRLGMAPEDEVYYEEAERGSERDGSGCEGESVENCSYDR